MLELKDLLIAPHETLRTALERMTKNHKGILFVCDHGDHLEGALSDGDVRRTLLDNTLLVAPVSKAMNLDPVMAQTTDEASVLLRHRGLVAVPVVDAEGRVQEIVVEGPDEVEVLRWPEQHPAAEAQNGTPGVVAVIPARGGSQRIPRKNLADVAGKPLVTWAIEAAQAAHSVGYVLVSTDDEEIAGVARQHGLDVPWMRPDELARDDTPTLDVVLHALAWTAQTLDPVPEIGVLLEPTAPLRKPEHIDRAVGLLLASEADSVVSVSELPHVFNPEELLVIEQGMLRPYLPDRTMDTRCLRGQQRRVYVQNGLVYAFRVHTVLEQRSLYGAKVVPFVTEWEYFLDIDTPNDVRLAHFQMKQRGQPAR